jgi:hypothetical protein
MSKPLLCIVWSDSPVDGKALPKPFGEAECGRKQPDVTGWALFQSGETERWAFLQCETER